MANINVDGPAAVKPRVSGVLRLSLQAGLDAQRGRTMARDQRASRSCRDPQRTMDAPVSTIRGMMGITRTGIGIEVVARGCGAWGQWFDGICHVDPVTGGGLAAAPKESPRLMVGLEVLISQLVGIIGSPAASACQTAGA